MGIRFSCHHCGHPLNIKQDLAGKVGRCPTCQGQFRIPLSDAAISSPINGTDLQSASVEPAQPIARAANSQAPAGTTSRSAAHAAGTAVSTKPAPSPSAKTPSAKTPSAKTPSTTTSVPRTAPRNPASQPTTQPTAKAAPANRQPVPDTTPAAQPHWHVRPPSGGEYGPASDELIRTWISEYRVTPSSELKRSDWKEWRVASEVFPDLLPKSIQTSTHVTTTSQPAAIIASTATAKSESNNHSTDQASAEVASDLVVNEPMIGDAKLIGDAKIGQKRMAKLRRRTTLVIALGIVTLLLIGVLLFLMLRPKT